MNIGDVFFRALIEDKELQTQAVKVGDQAGKTMGQRLSMSLGGAIKATAFTALAGGAAIAAKGLIELEDFQAKFIAQTGQSETAAKAAATAINQIAGRNLQPLSEVGDVLIGVTQNMQLTGDAANKMTEEILKFSTATGTEAVPNVKAFDDIMDAWNLTADQTTVIMDKLVVSHQKYGGSITENEDALRTFAPQLKALNATIDDGIGLLNLFANSGLDAGSATRALNTAVKNIKPGQSLDDLIQKVIAIKNPTDRAQEAIHLFGARGGVALANALRPGITGLKDFEVSASDAAGATDAAAQQIEDTFGNRFRLALKAAGSAIIGVGQSFGPLLTGLASAVSLAAAFHLDKPIIAAFKALVGNTAISGAATAVGEFIGTAFSKAFAIAEKLVEAAAEGLNAIADRTGVKAAAEKAGEIIGTIFAAAFEFGKKVTGVLVNAFNSLPFVAAATSAVSSAATKMGTIWGGAFSVAATAALVAAPVVITFQLKSSIDKFLGGLNPFQSQKDKDAVNAFTDYLQGVGDGSIVPAAAQVGQKAGDALATGVVQGFKDRRQDALEGFGDVMVSTWKAIGAPKVSTVVSSSIGNMKANWIKVAHDNGLRTAQALAQGFQDGRDAVNQQWQSFLNILKNAESPMKERARLLGELTSKALQQGLHSQDPYVRATAETTKQVIIDRLNELKSNTRNIGKQGMEFLRQGMKSKDLDIRSESKAIYNAAISHTKDLPTAGYGYGLRFATGLAHGMTSPAAAKALIGASTEVARIVNKYTKISSPAEAGPWSEDGGPEGSGKRFAESLARGIRGGSSAVADAASALTAGAVPGAMAAGAGATLSRSVLGGVGSTSSATTFSVGEIHLHGVGSDVSPNAAARFGKAIVDEMGKTFRQEGARIGLHPAIP